MKKFYAFTFVFILFINGCAATVADIEKKREAGQDTIVENYDYGWENVFESISYVWRYSEDSLISLTYLNCSIDFIKEKKSIFVKITGFSSVDMGIYFVPEGSDKTKVQFVKGEFTGGAWRETKIERLIDESKYLLKNGKDAYQEYTHEQHLKRMEKNT